MKREELETLTRRDLQKLAKENGVKANGKSATIIEDLLQVLGQQGSAEDQREEPQHQHVLQDEQEQVEEMIEDEQPRQKELMEEQQQDLEKEELMEEQEEQNEDQDQDQENVQELKHASLERPIIRAERKRPSGKRKLEAETKPAKLESAKKIKTNDGAKSKPLRVAPSPKTAVKTEKKKKFGELLNKEKENLTKSTSTIPRVAPGNIRAKFDKVHEKMFNNQKSILEAKTPKKKTLSVRDGNAPHISKPTTEKKAPRTGQKKNFIVGKPQEKRVPKKFDLQASLAKPVTWKMKTGPLEPLDQSNNAK